MANVRIQGNASGTGTLTIAAPNTNTDRTLTLPDSNGSMVLADSSGNVGIGVTPSAWGSSVKVAQVSNASIAGQSNQAIFSNNAFFDGAGWKYISSSPASQYYLDINAQHQWLNAPSGTASNAITFTQAMTLDSGGRLTVPNQPAFWVWNGGIITSSQFIIFGSGDLNVGGHYSGATGRFTAPVAGLYQFNCMALHRANQTTGNVELTFFKNGANISQRYLAYASGSGGSHTPLHIQTFLQLAAGDYVQPYALVSPGGTDLYLNERLSWFCGRLVN